MIKKLVLTTLTAATVALSVGAMTTSAEARSGSRHSHHGLEIYIGGPYHLGHHRLRGCHITRVWFKHHWHKARVCNGHIVKIW